MRYLRLGQVLANLAQLVRDFAHVVHVENSDDADEYRREKNKGLVHGSRPPLGMAHLTTLALLLLLLAFPARAQFNGYTSPQTVVQKIFSGQTTAAVSPNTSPTAPSIQCTPVNGTPCPIQNVGQTLHSVTYVISPTCTTGFSLDLRIEATNDGVNWFSISEDATDQTGAGAIQGASIAGLTATGTYAGYRLNLVQISCPSGQTPAVTAFYSGTSTTNPSANGVFYQSSMFRKLLLQNVPTTSSPAAVTINSPTGNSAGALFISCYFAATGATTSCPANTITFTSFVQFGGSGGGNIVNFTNTFTLPTTILPVLQMASVPSISLNFSFGGAGTAGVNWTVYYLANSQATSRYVADPCQNPGSVKGFAQVQIVSATTTQLIPTVAGQTIYVCGGFVEIASSGTTAATITFEYGTGATCGTGTVAFTGPMGTGTATAGIGPLAIPLSSGVTNFAIPPTDNFCAVTTGTTVSANGWINFVSQ